MQQGPLGQQMLLHGSSAGAGASGTPQLLGGSSATGTAPVIGSQNTGLIGAQASASHVPQAQGSTTAQAAQAQVQAADFTGVNSTTELHRLSEKVIKRIEDAIKEKDS